MRPLILAFSIITMAHLSALQPSLATPRGPNVALDDNAGRCTHPTTNLRGDVQLERRCYYEQTFKIKTSNTTLDCQGAQLRADDAYSIDIRGTIDGVTVKNCFIQGGKGIADQKEPPPDRPSLLLAGITSLLPQTLQHVISLLDPAQGLCHPQMSRD